MVIAVGIIVLGYLLWQANETLKKLLPVVKVGGGDNVLASMARRGGAGDAFSPNTKFLGEIDSPGNEGTPLI